MTEDNKIQVEIKSKVQYILQSEQGDYQKQLEQIISLFEQDQFDVITQLEDLVIANESTHIFEKSQSILLTLLLKAYSNDKYRIETTFNKILQNYLQQDNVHLVEILSFLLVHFNSFVYLDGALFLKYLISPDIQRIQRILKMLKVALRPLQNQIDQNDLNIQISNILQKQAVQIVEEQNLVEGLLMLSEKNIPTVMHNKKKINAKQEVNEIIKNDNIQRLAINCLFQLRNHLTKLHQKKLLSLLVKGMNDIQMICDNDSDLISEYLYYLLKNKEDFQKGKEIVVFNQISFLINSYLSKVTIKDSCYEFNKIKKQKLIKQLESIEDIMVQCQSNELQKKENQQRYLNRVNLEKQNPSRYLICKEMSLQFCNKIIQNKIPQKLITSFFNMLIHVAIIPFTTYLSNKDIPQYDNNFQEEIWYIYGEICKDLPMKNKFLDYILMVMESIDKRSEIQYEQPNIQDEENKSIFEKLQKGIKVVNREDKFVLIGCYQILEKLTSSSKEDIKGYLIKFTHYLSYQLLDEYLFSYCILFLAEMGNQFNFNLLQFHKSFIPQLCELLDQGDIPVKYYVADSLAKMYEELPNQKIKEMHNYLRGILRVCVREYMSNDFFCNKLQDNYYKSIRSLIKIIINLKDIQYYLKEEICQSQKIFLEMIQNKDKREHLIQNNHQDCLLSFLEIEIRQDNVSKELRNQIIAISKELALKIYQRGKNLSIQEKISIYQFLSQLKVESLGSQEIFDEIFLYIIPYAIEDTKTDISITFNHQSEDSHQDNPDESQSVENEDQEQDEEEDEDNNQSYVTFKQPDEKNCDLVAYSLAVLFTFSNQSVDLFFNHKKFEVLQVVNELISKDMIPIEVMIQVQKTIGVILISIQNYLTQQENESGSISENTSFYAESSLVEMDPLINLLLLRFKEKSLESSFYEDSLNSTILYGNFDLVLLRLLTTISELNEKTANSFFDQIFLTLERVLYNALEKRNIRVISLCQYGMRLLLKLTPSKIVQSIKITWKLTEEILRDNQSVGRDATQNEFKLSMKQIEQGLKKEIKSKKENQLQINIDPISVIQLISSFPDLLQDCPKAYYILSPAYHQIIINEEFFKYEQYLQHVCQFIKRSIFHCSSFLDTSIVKQYYSIFEKLVKDIHPDYYQELSPIENLRITFAMLGILMYDKLSVEQKNNINCFESLFEYIPLFDETLEYPFVYFIIEKLIELNIKLNSIQQAKIIKQLLFAIDNPEIHEIKEHNIIDAINMIKLMQTKNNISDEAILNIIDNEEWKTSKEILLQKLSQNQ